MNKNLAERADASLQNNVMEPERTQAYCDYVEALRDMEAIHRSYMDTSVFTEEGKRLTATLCDVTARLTRLREVWLEEESRASISPPPCTRCGGQLGYRESGVGIWVCVSCGQFPHESRLVAVVRWCEGRLARERLAAKRAAAPTLASNYAVRHMVEQILALDGERSQQRREELEGMGVEQLRRELALVTEGAFK